MSVWDEARTSIKENPQAGVWEEAEVSKDLQSQSALKTWELLNDERKKEEDYLENPQQVKDTFSLAADETMDRQRQAEVDMVSISTGMPR